MRRSAGRLAAAALLGGLLLPAWSAPPAAADVEAACDPDNDQESPSATPGRPFESMRIAEMQDWFDANRGGRPVGDGVVVAVLDSGVIAPGGPIPVVQQVNAATATPGATYFHGTAVAGIIAGAPAGQDRIGIAPGAAIFDVKIYDDDDASDGSVAVSNQTVFAGLEQVEEALATLPIKVVNLSVAVPDDVGVESIIRRLWRKGVIVVAASGNRPSGNPEDFLVQGGFDVYEGGENAAEVVYPAGYDDVVAATTTIAGLPAGDTLTNYILQSTAIDVAVPTSGALSYALGGTPCVLKRPATSWAAAEVSGVLAALASAYPDERPRQLVTRLESTTNGRRDVRTPLTGAGVVQPYAAMTRPLVVDKKGGYDQTQPVETQEQAQVPAQEVDPLVSTRDNMVWFGIVGGGVLVLALVLRPVLARRRRT